MLYVNGHVDGWEMWRTVKLAQEGAARSRDKRVASIKVVGEYTTFAACCSRMLLCFVPAADHTTLASDDEDSTDDEEETSRTPSPPYRPALPTPSCASLTVRAPS